MQGWGAALLTLKEFESEWREALSLSSLHAHAEEEDCGGEDKNDPFDCSSVEILSLHELVEETARKHVREWKALDERKINAVAAPAEPTTTDRHEGGLLPPPPAKKQKKKWVAVRQDTGMPLWYDHPNRIRLPHGFDYLCRHPTAEAAVEAAAVAAAEAAAASALPGGDVDPASPPPVPDDPRVQSLVDPALTTSYHAELWNLFARVPPAERLRRHACDDDDGASADSRDSRREDALPVSLPRMRRLASWYSRSSYFPSQQQIKQKQQDPPTAAEDSMCLWTRLRLSDRHEPPPPFPSITSSSSSRRDPPGTDLLTTIRFECWRGRAPPSRTILPDPNRMSVELFKSHTLLDFHRVLVEQARDDLWTKLGDVEGANTSDESTSNDASSTDAGFFFIEDTFYISGTSAVEYVQPILAWLAAKDQDDSHDDASVGERDRLSRLGVPVASVDDLKVVQMSETRLEDLPLRLGIRYAHVHHGNVECSVYCVDRRVQVVRSCTDGTAAGSRLDPILHDVWTSPHPTPACEACQHQTAALVSAPTCEATDGGPRPLCRPCARLLQVPRSELELYSVYRGT